MKRDAKAYLRIFPIVCLLACGGWGTRPATAAPLPVRSVQKDAKGVTMKLESGLLRLEVCDDRTIHVACSPADPLPAKKEYVVTRQWTPVPFDWRKEQSRLVLRTPRMSVSVDRATGGLTFADAAGKTLLQEPADGGKTFSDPKAAGARPAANLSHPADVPFPGRRTSLRHGRMPGRRMELARNAH